MPTWRRCRAGRGLRRRPASRGAGPGPAAEPSRSRAGWPAAGAVATVVLVLDGDTDAPLDIEHDAAVGVEELVSRLRPAAEVVDGEQAARLREVAFRGDVLVERPVAVLEEDTLRVLRHEEVDEGLGLIGVLAVLRDRDGVLDEDGLVGNRVLELLTVLVGEDRLVLIGEHGVALAAGEGLQRLAGAVVLDRDVLEQVVQILDAGLLVLADVTRGAVGSEHVPAGTTRG